MVAIDSRIHLILPINKEQCIKESNTLAGIAAINILQRELLLNTKRQYMKESDTLADNAAINLFKREILLDIKVHCMKE